MRFLEGGPDIPNELLEARDDGEVVFLCGAGVSKPVGLPMFGELTRDVCAFLGQDFGQLTEDDTVSLDQAFSRLQRKFGDKKVLAAVERKLRTPRGASTKYHEALLQLSSNHEGKPRLVTTNFDLLFEKARSNIPQYISPVLPDFRVLEDFEGLVYLHGRLSSKTTRPENRSQLILSSMEFGDAYLSRGWAAGFVRELLEKYTVVLVGYTANDPPIKYLLEGLSLSKRGRANKIYSFAPGPEAEVKAYWRERNTIAIPYENLDGSHSLLWDTLVAWAQRAKSPEKWQNSLVKLTSKRPSELTPIKRGQIVELVSSAVGAKKFADAAPSPHPEWLCVFDPSIRMAKPQTGSVYFRRDEFDPQQTFGLDTDPPRLESDNLRPGYNDIYQRSIDVLTAFPGEFQSSKPKGIVNVYRRQSEQLPTRLWHLGRWIAKIAHQPVTIWWLSRQFTLSKELIQQLKWGLENSGDDAFTAYTPLSVIKDLWTDSSLT